MADYQRKADGGVIRASDGAHIPADERNADWREYLAWQAKGNAPDAPPQAPTKPRTRADILETLSSRQWARIVAAAGDP